MDEYKKHVEKDAALERRFQPVTVNEPSVEDSVEMLRGIKHYYEEYHGVTISEEMCRLAVSLSEGYYEMYHRVRISDRLLYLTVTLSERYINDRFLPDKAIDLLDEAASALSLASAPLNESHEIRDKLLVLKQEREELENAPADQEKNEQLRYEKIAKIKANEMQLAEKLNISIAKVYSVATFYENFSLEPKGKYVIKCHDRTKESIQVVLALNLNVVKGVYYILYFKHCFSQGNKLSCN